MKSRITRCEVLALLDLEDDFLLALEREEIVACEPPGRYHPDAVERIRLCQTLHQELGVNLAGIEVAIYEGLLAMPDSPYAGIVVNNLDEPYGVS